jgi:hypothetical protein
MIRIVSIAILGLAFGLAAVGCKKAEAPRNDQPLKTETDNKGKRGRAVSATLEDPNAPPRKK